MSDNMYLNERVAPHQLKYSNMTPLSFNAKSSKRIFFTSNQSTYSQSNNVIRIPISSGTSFLDGPNSYLKFDYVNNEAGNNIIHQFSGSAHALIYRLRVIADNSGEDLENILYYGHAHNLVADLMLDPAKRATRAEQGYGAFGVIPQVALPGAAYAQNVATANLAQITNGRTLVLGSSFLGCDEMQIPTAGGAAILVAAGIQSSNSQTICIPLDLSCLLGGGQKKFLPLFLCGGITVEITIDPFGVNSSVGTPPQFNIANVQFHAQCIDFDASVNQQLTQMVQSSGLFMHGTSWTNVLTQLASGVQSWIVSERLKSVKSIFFAFNDPTSTSTAYFRPHNRQTNRLSNFQLKIGSDYYPSQRVMATSNDASWSKNNGEFLNETFKAIAEYQNTYHSALLNVYNFAQDINPVTTGVAAAGNLYQNSALVAGGVGNGITQAQAYQFMNSRAMYGLDVDAFGRSDTESGVNTILNNPITFNFQQTAPYGQPLNAYSYLLHDVVFTIDQTGRFSCSK